ncbi:transposable element tcb1 transposase [Trichonephila clavipes]|nr:transposable element tcb1 transposase [Trichonephila clavipes]
MIKKLNVSVYCRCVSTRQTKEIRKKTPQIDGPHYPGVHSRAATHKPLITKSNHAARLRWCKVLQYPILDKWKQVLWSDESRFNLYQLDNRVCICRIPGVHLVRMHCAYSKVWLRWNCGVGMFLMVQTVTLVDPNSW